MVECKCGCGSLISAYDDHGRRIRFANGHFTVVLQKKGNKLENRMSELLKEANIFQHFSQQAPIFGGVADFLSWKLKIIIETDGCFWHACPIHYKRNSLLYEAQYRVIQHDRRFNETAKKHNFTVVRIWEHEVKEEPYAVLEKILTIIDKRDNINWQNTENSNNLRIP